MKKALFFFISIAGLLFKTVFAEVDVERKPLSIGGYIDFGQIMNGDDTREPAHGDYKIDRMALQRTGAGVTQETVVNNKLTLRVGVGGLFFYPSPQWFASPASLLIKFGPGISEAQALYKFGDPDNSMAEIQFGFFGYKYNPDAVNLGEYLLRSNTYPGILYTGGWSLMNSAGYGTVGARIGFNHMDGALKNDILLIMERENFPINSFSPAYVGSINLGNVLEIGWGFHLQHLIPIKPSWLTPDEDISTWVEFSGITTPIPADTTTNTYPGFEEATTLIRPPITNTYSTLKSDAVRKDYLVNGTKVSIYHYAVWHDNLNNTDTLTDNTGMGSAKIWRNLGTGVYDAVDHTGDPSWEQVDRYARTAYVFPREETKITFRGVKAMGRLSLNLGSMMGIDDLIGPGSFKIFAEACILGLQNQPMYYENMADRIPLMIGINIPTFKLLDLLAVQVEYFKNQFYNSNDKYLWSGIPAYEFNGDTKLLYDNDPTDWNKDNLKWTVYLKRSITSGVTIYAQAASDHLRTIDDAFFFTREPVFQEPSQWYYLTRVEFGF